MQHRTSARLFLLAVLFAAAVANAAGTGVTESSGPLADTTRSAELEVHAPHASASRLDRIEFVSFQLAYGTIDGGILGVFSGPLALVSFLGEIGGRGLGALLWCLQPGFDASQGMAINAGTFWGHLWSVFLAYAIVGNHMSYPALVGFLGGAAGTFIGGAFGYQYRPPPGAMAMANSGAAWGAVLALIVRGPWSHVNADWQVTYAAIEVASIGGFVSGLLLSKLGVPPRGSVLLVDLGGIAGLIVGMKVADAIRVDEFQHPLLFAVAVGGFTAGGLGLGAMLTRLFVPASSGAHLPALSLAPMGRDGFGLAVQSRF